MEANGECFSIKVQSIRIINQILGEGGCELKSFIYTLQITIYCQHRSRRKSGPLSDMFSGRDLKFNPKIFTMTR